MNNRQTLKRMIILASCLSLVVWAGIYSPLGSVNTDDTVSLDAAEPALALVGGEEPEPEPELEPEPEPDPSGPVIALTFDDGPNDCITPQLITQLNQRGAQATFFVLGVLAERYPEIMEQMVQCGHLVASHGWDHKNRLTELTDEQLQEEISNSNQAIYQAIGIDPLYLRPAYGTIEQETAGKIDMPLILWNVDPRDWEQRDAEHLRQYIVDNAFDGAVFVLHDQYQSTLDGVMAAVDDLVEQGYRFVTLEEYYRYFDIVPEPGWVYRGTSLKQ
jgi:peptidoglycan-N-acetylglucosamine deacetylase